MLVLFSVLDQQGRQGGVVGNETTVILTLAQEGSQGLQGVWGGPIFDDGGILGRDADALSNDLVSEVLDVVLEKLSLFRRDLKSSRTKVCSTLRRILR